MHKAVQWLFNNILINLRPRRDGDLSLCLLRSLLCDVLEECAEDVEDIEYLSDSSWRAVTHRNREPVQHQRVKHSKTSCVHFSVLVIQRIWFEFLIDVNYKPLRGIIVDLTQSSSDEEDLHKETVSTHLEDKSVRFRKSARVKTTKPNRDKTQVHAINWAWGIFLLLISPLTVFRITSTSVFII